MFYRFLLIILLIIFLGPLTAIAADLEREKRLASEVEDSVVVGDPYYLDADGHEFLTLFAENEADEVKGAAIILHGRGLHPNWPQVTAPLRSGLIEHGWHTLSIQLPVLEKDAKYYDYVPILPESFPRIQAAINFLREQDEKVDRIALIAHSCGVHMSMAYVENFGDADFYAYVGIGMGATDAGQPMRKPFPLEKMTIPVLAVHGGEDYPTVLRAAPKVLAAITKAGDPNSKQVVVVGADHYFEDDVKAEALVVLVADWLNHL